jgi:hypothetical protein
LRLRLQNRRERAAATLHLSASLPWAGLAWGAAVKSGLGWAAAGVGLGGVSDAFDAVVQASDDYSGAVGEALRAVGAPQ